MDEFELALIRSRGAQRYFWRFSDGDQSRSSFNLNKDEGIFPSLDLAYAPMIDFITGKCGYWDMGYDLDFLGAPISDDSPECEPIITTQSSSAKSPIYL